jgi:5'-nucleotidase
MPFFHPSARRAALALVLALVQTLAVAAQETREPTVRVTLLQVNDVYQFMPVERGTQGGLARLSTLRKRIMKESPNTLFLLSGDTISPSVESITYKGAQMIEAWNAVGLDYSVFGNHEFDFDSTPGVLLQRVSESKFKWLGANVFDTKTGRLFADTRPFDIREFGGVKVGIFGITLPATKTTSSPGPEVEFRDSCETAKQIIPQIRAAGARTIIALTHLSLVEDKELARCAPGIDIIIGGHEHTLLQSSSRGVPIFKMTADGREMGRIDLNIDPKTGEVASIDWKIIPVNACTPEDPEFEPVKKKYADLLTKLGARVGHTDEPLDVSSAANRTGETNIADFVADSFRKAAGADVALVNGGSLRADTVISKGDITLRDVLSILPFNNQLSKIEVTGATLLEALEHGVSRSGPGSEPGSFPQVSGLRYSFDARLPSGARIKEVTVAGRPLDAKKTYTLVTTKYVADGGDQYAMFKAARRLPLGKMIDSEVLRQAIASVKSIAPRTDGRVRRLDAPPPVPEQTCNPSTVAPPAASAAPGR